MTTIPRMLTVSSMSRIASTAAWSAAILLPRPIQRAANVAADSVTRTSSSARFRSGMDRSTSLTSSDPTSAPSHLIWSFDPDQIEAAGDDLLGCEDQGETERLGLLAEDAMAVVEAVKVVRETNCVVRDRVRRPPL